jgi:hypothetical protein
LHNSFNVAAITAKSKNFLRRKMDGAKALKCQCHNLSGGTVALAR